MTQPQAFALKQPQAQTQFQPQLQRNFQALKLINPPDKFNSKGFDFNNSFTPFIPAGFNTLGGFGDRKGSRGGFKFKVGLSPSFSAIALDLKGLYPKVDKTFGINPFQLRLQPKYPSRKSSGRKKK